MKTVAWDRVVSSSPLDTKAAVVRDGIGEADPFANAKAPYSPDGPPKLEKINQSHLSNPEFIDFTGQRFGRLMVLGMIDRAEAGLSLRKTSNSNSRARWAVRCVCGTYESRVVKTLKKYRDDPSGAMCSRCGKQAYVLSGRKHDGQSS